MTLAQEYGRDLMAGGEPGLNITVGHRSDATDD